MTHASDIVTDTAAIFDTDEYAQSATYNDATVTVIPVDYRERRNREQGGRSVFELVVKVKTADVAVPAYRDTLVLSGTTWRLMEWQGGLFVWTMTFETDERPAYG